MSEPNMDNKKNNESNMDNKNNESNNASFSLANVYNSIFGKSKSEEDTQDKQAKENQAVSAMGGGKRKSKGKKANGKRKTKRSKSKKAKTNKRCK